MTPSNTAARDRAARAGLDFLYSFALIPEHFDESGSDLLNFFSLISTRARDAEVRRAARRMGRERARRWRHERADAIEGADAYQLFKLIFGADAADRLLAPDPALKSRLRRALRRYPVTDYLRFDPVREPPPEGVPDRCPSCGRLEARGRTRCGRCDGRLWPMTRYKVWYRALIRTYIAATYGVSLGAHYRHVIKWLPLMRPYRASLAPEHAEFYDTVFAVTHVVYTLGDYDAHKLSPAWLPDEYRFLVENFPVVLRLEDTEMVGEFCDTLRALGVRDSHPLARAGFEYLLARQNRDGSWGETASEDIYRNYHATLCAVGGLLDYRWRGERLTFPYLRPSLERWAKVKRD